jgi:hypothetical protein
MDIREDMISNIRHNDPLAGPMVLIPGKVFSKLLNPGQSQEPETTKEGYIFPWTMDEHTIKYIMENNGDIITVDSIVPEEILVIKKHLLDYDNSGHTHDVIEIRSGTAKGTRYLRQDEPTLEEFMSLRLKETGKDVSQLIREELYGDFCSDTRAKYLEIINRK